MILIVKEPPRNPTHVTWWGTLTDRAWPWTKALPPGGCAAEWSENAPDLGRGGDGGHGGAGGQPGQVPESRSIGPGYVCTLCQTSWKPGIGSMPRCAMSRSEYLRLKALEG